jgi:hypothetical protein
VGLHLFGTPPIGAADPSNRDPCEPDPSIFEIKSTETIGRFVVASVKYPNCPTYNGNKILIYDYATEDEVRGQQVLDPHFTIEGFSPIARFPANPRGLWMAREFCRLFSEEHPR